MTAMTTAGWKQVGSGIATRFGDAVDAELMEVNGPADVLEVLALVDTPDWVPPVILIHEAGGTTLGPLLGEIVGVVSTVGTIGAHVALLAKEYGCPCIVGAKIDEPIGERQRVRLCADGSIWVAEAGGGEPVQAMMPAVYVNLSVPGRAAEAVALGVDGVGLMRAEFLAFQTGQHPLLLLEAEPPGDLTSIVAEGIRTVARELHPRPLLYRSLDLRSNDLRNLAGGDRLEAEEENPALGCRGISRSQRDAEMFRAELAALAKVRGEGFDNVRLMLPFVRWPEEVSWARDQLATVGLGEGSGFELWMMVETPAAIFRAAEFAPLVDGVSIGSNDLTQLLLGIDRDNAAFSDRSFDLDPAVVEGLRLTVDAYAACGVPVGICGDAPSRSEELLRMLITWGLASVSVSLDRVAALQQLVAQAGELTTTERFTQ